MQKSETSLEENRMPDNFDFHAFFKAVIRQDAAKLRTYFEPDAHIFWSNTNEEFTVDEYVRANCEYPGQWEGKVERVDKIKGYDQQIVFVARVWNAEGAAARVVSFVQFGDTEDELIAMLDENWGDIDLPEGRLNGAASALSFACRRGGDRSVLRKYPQGAEAGHAGI
jgi:hypothetical protein